MNYRSSFAASIALCLALLTLATPATANDAKKVPFVAAAVGILQSVDGNTGVFDLTGADSASGRVTGQTKNHLLDGEH